MLVNGGVYVHRSTHPLFTQSECLVYDYSYMYKTCEWRMHVVMVIIAIIHTSYNAYLRKNSDPWIYLYAHIEIHTYICSIFSISLG